MCCKPISTMKRFSLRELEPRGHPSFALSTFNDTHRATIDSFNRIGHQCTATFIHCFQLIGILSPHRLGFFFFFFPFLNLSKLNVSRSLHNAHVTSLFFLFLFLKEWWSSPIGWFYSFVIPTDAAQTLKKRMGGESHRIVEDLRIETTWLE